MTMIEKIVLSTEVLTTIKEVSKANKRHE